MKNSKDTIGIRTRDLPACSTVEQEVQRFISVKSQLQSFCPSVQVKQLDDRLSDVSEILF
jgi:hypothetical protein